MISIEYKYKILFFISSIPIFLATSFFIRKEDFIAIIFLLIILFALVYLFWKIRGIMILSFSVILSLFSILFPKENFFFLIIMIFITYLGIEIIHFLYMKKKSIIKNNFQIMKKKKTQFIDEIIKESQFRSIFVANLSHDLRSPLNAILGFTDLLIEDLRSVIDENYLDYLKNINESGRLLLDLINNLIHIAKIDTGNLLLESEEIIISDFIQDINNSLEPIIISKDLKYEYHPNFNSKTIYADRLKLKQIITKLLTNSITSTQKGVISFNIQENLDKWEFIITDTGGRFNERELDFILHPFYKLDSKKIEKGKELGFDLILAKRLIELHKGKLVITSNLGVGTKYTFFIPKKSKN